MLPFIMFFLICFVSHNTSFAGTKNLYTTVMNGSWTTTSIWSPTVCPTLSDDITISHSVANFTNLNLTGSILIESSGTLSSLDMTVSNGAVLLVYGTLNLDNITLNNGSTLCIFPSGVVAISGDFNNKNNTINIVIDGNLIVGGNFTNGFGGIISGSGAISVSGIFDGDGTTYDTSPTDLIPPNSTIPLELPIELLDFGISASDNNVIISWKTASEINNDYFTIEKSDDGIAFYELARIQGKGFSNLICSYNYYDKLLNSGIIYYRLVQTDYNGNSKVFNSCALKIESNPSEIKDISVISIGPNPFASEFKIRLAAQKSISVNVILINEIGKIFYEEKRQLSEGINEFLVTPDTNIKPGLCFVHILVSNEESLCYKMIKSSP